MKTRHYTNFGGDTVVVLFEKSRCAWSIEATRHGIRFNNGYNTDYPCIYSDARWACDYPERLPKYAVSAMNNLLKRYGAEGLKAICRECA